MKSILLLNTSFYPNAGGVESSLKSISIELVNQGWKVDVLAPLVAQESQSRRNKAFPGVNFILFENRGFPFYYFKIYSALKKLNTKYDVILSRNHITTYLAQKAGLENVNYLIPGVVKFQNVALKGKSIKEFLRYYCDLYIQKRAFSASKLFAFSDSTVEQIHAIDTSFRVHRVNPGIDKTRFFPVHLDKKKLIREQLKLPLDKKLVLAMGRFEKVKGFEMLIKAMIHLDDQMILVLVGTGNELHTYKKLIDELNLAKKVIFTGVTSQPELYFRSSDVFALTSIHETFGQVLLEATASGLPVAAFDSDLEQIDTATGEIYSNYSSLCNFSERFESKTFAEAINLSLTQEIINEERDDLLAKYDWFKLVEDLENS